MSRRRRGRRRGWAGALVGLIAVVAVAGAGPAAADEPGVTELCRLPADVLPEVSGLTWSARHPGVVWAHDDSGGGPRLYAVDTSDCRVRATLTLAGAEARDLEAIATGADAAGEPVLWAADIGDNVDSWPDVRVLAVPEPRRLVDAVVAVTTYEFTYADRPHDAETLLADPARERLWPVTKQLARGGLYVLPSPLRAGTVMTAKRVADVGGLTTDGSVAPDGSRYVLRDYLDARVYDGLPPGEEIVRVELPAQPQGEAVTWAADGRALVVASERDRRLLRVDLPPEAWTAAAQAAAPPSESSPTTQPSTGGPPSTASQPGSATPAAEPGPASGVATWALVGVLLLSAGGLVAWVRARHHR